MVGFGDWMAGADFSGMTISNLVDTGVSPGRRFQLLFIGLSLDFRAAYSTFFASSQARYPSGLTLAHQPAHSSNPKANYSLVSHKGGRSNPIYVKEAANLHLARCHLAFRIEVSFR